MFTLGYLYYLLSVGKLKNLVISVLDWIVRVLELGMVAYAYGYNTWKAEVERFLEPRIIDQSGKPLQELYLKKIES